MIDTIIAILTWVLIALSPIAVILIAIRLVDRRQRRHSKHLRIADDD